MGCVSSAASKKPGEDREDGAVLEAVRIDIETDKQDKEEPEQRPHLDLSGLQRSIGSLGLASKAQLAFITRWWAACGLDEQLQEAVEISFAGDGSVVEMEVPVPAGRLPDVLPALLRLLPANQSVTSKKVAAVAVDRVQSKGEAAAIGDTSQESGVVVVADATSDGRPKAKAKAKVKAKPKVRAGPSDSGEVQSVQKPEFVAMATSEELQSLALVPQQFADTERRQKRLELARSSLPWSEASVWLRLAGLKLQKRGRAHVDFGISLSASIGKVMEGTRLGEWASCSSSGTDPVVSKLQTLQEFLDGGGITAELGWGLRSVRFSLNDYSEGPEVGACFECPNQEVYAPHEEVDSDVELEPQAEDVEQQPSWRETMLKSVGVNSSSPFGSLALTEGTRLAVTTAATAESTDVCLKVELPPDAHDSLTVDLCVGERSAVDGMILERFRRVLADVNGAATISSVASRENGLATVVMRVTSAA